MAETTVDVVVQIAGEDVLAGRLWAHRRRGAESATFACVPEYVALPGAYELDPALPLATGQQQTPVGRATFGAFSDCAPDRWGRRLIQRTEQNRVRHAGGAERSFGEIIDVAEHFRLSRDEAGAILRDVVAATRTWRREALELGLGAAALDQMAPAFEHSQADGARELVGAIA